MLEVSSHLLALRVVISCVGLTGNVYLIFFIIQTRVSSVKTFELFLLGLATANLEEIVIVNIYDIVILQKSYVVSDAWLCRSVKFLTVFGEMGSILFTVLISVYRYQKLRDAVKRVNLPIYLDNIHAAWTTIWLCVGISILLSSPIFVMNLQGPTRNLMGNHTWNHTGCSPDFFLCSSNHCPTVNRLYKYTFILLCYLMPLGVVTVTSSLIVVVLLGPRTAVKPIGSVSGSDQIERKRNVRRLHRSTIAVLAAMVLFLVDWTLYLFFQMTFNATDFPFWVELEFFISISYTSISPYVFGLGKSLFTIKNLCKK
ncbi:uncharacterized protein LOC133146736 [Syngnathus typhle]|uniref:uncharacterized protein LOC133146736 n=1 Tax=Syngnathus typhle TaxID=161592 RepID=UPI002A6A1BC6|nr:uncharacterized protein LOC133146736 [Syngnathus typhle]